MKSLYLVNKTFISNIVGGLRGSNPLTTGSQPVRYPICVKSP